LHHFHFFGGNICFRFDLIRFKSKSNQLTWYLILDEFVQYLVIISWMYHSFIHRLVPPLIGMQPIDYIDWTWAWSWWSSPGLMVMVRVLSPGLHHISWKIKAKPNQSQSKRDCFGLRLASERAPFEAKPWICNPCLCPSECRSKSQWIVDYP
jgi:hypothetical protein